MPIDNSTDSLSRKRQVHYELSRNNILKLRRRNAIYVIYKKHVGDSGASKAMSLYERWKDDYDRLVEFHRYIDYLATSIADKRVREAFSAEAKKCLGKINSDFSSGSIEELMSTLKNSHPLDEATKVYFPSLNAIRNALYRNVLLPLSTWVKPGQGRV